MAVAQRRIREREARRTEILDAARELFFRKGFEGTTIEEIAEKTELSKGTIYLYFPSKEEIYISLMLEGSEILHKMLKASSIADLPADELLRRLGQAYFHFYTEYTGYFRMLFLYYSSENVHSKLTENLCQRCEDQAKQSLSLVAHVIQKGISDGMFRKCNPWEFAVLASTCQNGIILFAERGENEALQLGTSVEKLHELFIESMITSLKKGR